MGTALILQRFPQIHFIFRHQNPKTGEFEEKHLKLPPKPAFEKNTNLFTLHLL